MNKAKINRPRNWRYELYIILIGLALVGIWWIILKSSRKAVLAGAWTYLILAWSLRLIFQKHHMRGMKFMRERNYADAALAFQNSYEFFRKHPAIDKYRFITMFATSAFSYQQMALNNLGVCYVHLNEIEKAMETFRLLAEINRGYPNIEEVIAALGKCMDEAEKTGNGEAYAENE